MRECVCPSGGYTWGSHGPMAMGITFFPKTIESRRIIPGHGD